MAANRVPDARMTAARLMVKCLENEGVEYIFGVPGEENLALIDALSDSPIRFITTRHEQGAAFMADMYGRLTGRAGVCLSSGVYGMQGLSGRKRGGAPGRYGGSVSAENSCHY